MNNKPASVERYEQMLRTGEPLYLDPIEIEEAYHFYAEQNDFDRLDAVYELGKRLHPSDPAIIQMDAEMALNEDDAAKALSILEGIFQTDNPFHFILKSAAYAKLGKKIEAMEMASEALRLSSPSDFVHYDLALGFTNANDFVTALQYYRESLKQHPDDVRTLSGMLFCFAHMEGEGQNASATADRILKLDPFNYEAWMRKGVEYSDAGKYDEAIEAYDYALAIDPDEPNTLIMKSLCLERAGQKAEAARLLEEGVSRYEGDARCMLYAQLAVLLHDLHRDEEACDAAWKSMEAAPSDPDNLLRASVLCFEAHNPSLGDTLLKMALDIRSDNPALLTAACETLTQNGRAKAALPLIERLCILEPTASHFTLWGGVLMTLDRFGLAEKKLKQALKMDEQFYDYVLLAICHYNMQHPLKVEECLRYAFALNPDETFKRLALMCPDLYGETKANGFQERMLSEHAARMLRKERKLRRLADQRKELSTIEALAEALEAACKDGSEAPAPDYANAPEANNEDLEANIEALEANYNETPNAGNCETPNAE